MCLTEGEHTITTNSATTTEEYCKNEENKLVVFVPQLTVTGENIVDGVDYTYKAGVLTIKSSKAMTISGTTTTDIIVVAGGVPANITLDNVSIDVQAHGDNSVSDGDSDDDSVSGDVSGDTSDGNADSADDDENPPTGAAIGFAGIITAGAAVMLTRKRKNK